MSEKCLIWTIYCWFTAEIERWRSRALLNISFTQKLLTGKLQVLLWTRIQHPFMISIFVVSNSIFKFQKKISKILFWLFLIFGLFESDFGSFWEDFEELWSFGSDILIYLFVYCNNSTKITKIWHKLIVRIRKSPFLNQVFRRLNTIEMSNNVRNWNALTKVVKNQHFVRPVKTYFQCVPSGFPLALIGSEFFLSNNYSNKLSLKWCFNTNRCDVYVRDPSIKH